MSPAARPDRRRKAPPLAGFSILEILVALALVALMISLSAPLLRPAPSGLQTRAAARKLCAALTAARARAIAANAEFAFVLDLARKSYWAPALPETFLPADTRIDIKIAEARRRGAQRGDIVFFPSGSSSGGEITLTGGGRRATIDVNWLTGAARCVVE